MALGWWAPYHGAIFRIVGVLLSLAGAVVLVNRRRPASTVAFARLPFQGRWPTRCIPDTISVRSRSRVGT